MLFRSGRREVYVQAYPEPKGKWLVSSGGGSYPAWSPDGRAIYYVSGDSKLMAVNLKVGAESVQPSTPTELFGVAADLVANGGYPFAVSPDGQRFLVRVPAATSAPTLEVIVNWPALLKKGAAGE